MTKTTRITFLATPEQLSTLKAAAEREGRSLSNYILTAALRAATTEIQGNEMTFSTLKRICEASGFTAKRYGNDYAIWGIDPINPIIISPTVEIAYQAFCMFRTA